MLWNWFLASLGASNSKKYALPEWQEWKDDSAKLWFASENTQLQYSLDDVSAIEEVFLANCSLGTTVSNAFKRELSRIYENIKNHNSIFEIDWSATRSASSGNVTRVGVNGQLVAPPAPEHPGIEPKIGDFYSRVEYIKAKARWDVACWQFNAWKEKQDAQATQELTNEHRTIDADSEVGQESSDVSDEEGDNDTTGGNDD